MSSQFAGSPGGAAQRSDPATALIGRRDGLAAFRAQGEQALAAVVGALDGAQRVFDGARPGDIAGGIAAIDLDADMPPGFTAGLSELQSLYFDHAVYFHHPAQVHGGSACVAPAVARHG